MSWFSHKATEPDQVMLVMHDGAHVLVASEWFCDLLYASPYGPGTDMGRCELLVGGAVDGVSYVKGWKPASPNTEVYYCRLI
jgi:hypothetical protein